MPSMAGMYPKTPRKPSRPSAVYPASRSAPKKPVGYLSRIVSTLGLPRLSSSLFGTSNLPQPTSTPSTSAAPLPVQHPANYPGSSATSGPIPFGFRQILDITLNSGNQKASQQTPQQQQTQNEPLLENPPRSVSLPPDGDPPSDSLESYSGVLLPDNQCTPKGRSRRSQTADTIQTSASSTLGYSSLKLTKLVITDSKGKYKTAAVFDA